MEVYDAMYHYNPKVLECRSLRLTQRCTVVFPLFSFIPLPAVHHFFSNLFYYCFEMEEHVFILQ